MSPPLRSGGRRSGSTEDRCKTEPSPAGRDGARPLQGAAGCGHPALRKMGERHAGVVVPYGGNAGGARRRADVGIGPYGCGMGRVRGRTHGSAPTQRGRHSGSTGDRCETESSPVGRGGARPLQGAAAGCGHPALRGQHGAHSANGPPGSSAPTEAMRAVPSGGAAGCEFCRKGGPGAGWVFREILRFSPCIFHFDCL